MKPDTSTTDSPPSNAGASTSGGKGKPILCLDFDGVIHSYTSGWKGADVVSDQMVEGFLPWLVEAQKVFDVHIHSSRSGQPGGIGAMMDWMYKETARICSGRDAINRLPEFVDAVDSLFWPSAKPPAMVTIDDRAITFNGVWPDPARLLTFKPWYKR